MCLLDFHSLENFRIQIQPLPTRRRILREFLNRDSMKKNLPILKTLRVLFSGNCGIINSFPRDHGNQSARNPTSTRELLLGWYKEQARRKIPDRVNWYGRRIGLETGPIKITDARKRWGSCGKRNSLNFSWRLIIAPLHVLDYVVIHELAHTVERNHSRRFWSKVATMCPSYRSGMRWLKDNEHLLQI